MQNKHKPDSSQSTGRTGPSSSASSQNQRQRQSLGNSSTNPIQSNQQNKAYSSRHSDTANDQATAQLQAQAAQLQLAAAFANTPALAAFAQQQQQQQQQAAILQRLMAGAGSASAGFNPLQSLGLQSPAAAALNYLNMFPNQRKNP